MKTSLNLFFLLLFLTITLQADQFSLMRKLDVKATFFTTDQLGESYLVVNGDLYKYDETGNLIYTYSNKGAGQIKFVDASNPLRVLVFIPDFYTVYVLDSKLVLQSTIDLRQINFQQPTIICASKTEGFWVFEKQTSQLKKINFNLQTLIESVAINQLISDEPDPDFMAESDNWLVVNNPSTGLLIFDKFANYYKTLPVKNIHTFQISDDQLIYQEGNILKNFNIKNQSEQKYNVENISDSCFARIEQHRLFLLRNNSLEIYSY